MRSLFIVSTPEAAEQEKQAGAPADASSEGVQESKPTAKKKVAKKKAAKKKRA